MMPLTRHGIPCGPGSSGRVETAIFVITRGASWSGYVHPGRRQKWQHISRAFRVWELEDTVAGRRALRLRIEDRMKREAAAKCGLAEIGGQGLQSTLQRGWYYGPETFREWLLEKSGELLGKRSQLRSNYHGDEIKAHGENEALTLLTAGLAAAGINAADLAALPKSHPVKVVIASQIRRQTAVPLAWIAQQLHMGTPSNVSHACRRKSAPCHESSPDPFPLTPFPNAKCSYCSHT